MEVFDEALEGWTGVAYVPTSVATQVVAGINYRFTADATPVVPDEDAETYQVHIFIFKPLMGAPAELINIERL